MIDRHSDSEPDGVQDEVPIDEIVRLVESTDRWKIRKAKMTDGPISDHTAIGLSIPKDDTGFPAQMLLMTSVAAESWARRILERIAESESND